MVNIVILGTERFRNAQRLAVERLLERHGLPVLQRKDGVSEIWEGNAADAEIQFACDHYVFEGTLVGASSNPELMAFLAEAMELTGVYDSCPEHDKRHFWRGNMPAFVLHGIHL